MCCPECWQYRYSLQWCAGARHCCWWRFAFAFVKSASPRLHTLHFGALHAFLERVVCLHASHGVTQNYEIRVRISLSRQDAAACLNKVVNEISFKDYIFAEAIVKLFLTLSLLLAQKSEQAEIILRSISRKLSVDENGGRFIAAEQLAKFLKIALNDNSATKLKKLESAFATFSQVNKGKSAILLFVQVTPEHLQKLSK